MGHVFEKYGKKLNEIGVNPNNGAGQVFKKLASLSEAEQKEIMADLESCFEHRPDLAMVDSDKGITNLHVPSDVIIDASMPAMIRSSGKMWNKKGELQDTKCLIPDRSY